MKRLFVAIKIDSDDNFQSIFEELKSSLKHEKIKWVELHNLHLTLKFFGETEEDQIPAIIRSLKLALEIHNSFKFDINKLGIFGSRYNPKVIWAGIDGAEPIKSIEKSIRKKLEKMGLYADRQNFVPHLTLGRIKFLSDKDLFQDIMADFKNECFQLVSVREVLLLESTLTKQGPIYSVVESFKLKA